jgi:hypothetical protein
MHCRICGKSAKQTDLCKACTYYSKHGASEEALRRMYSDDETKKIWRENKKIAEELANAYYDSVIENYKAPASDSKENFGYNTFIDGIRLGLDVTLPAIDEELRKKIQQKIESMIRFRTKQNK